MSILPALTAKQVIRRLKKAGFVEDRQRGSHLILYHPHTRQRAVVPVHTGRSIKKPLLHQIIRDSGLSVDDFLNLA